MVQRGKESYFCMVDPYKRQAGKNASAIMYTDLPSSIDPVPHCSELPVLTSPERKQPSSEESSKSEEEVDVEDPDYNFRVAAGERNPYYSNQRDLNDLIRDRGLTKSDAELLTSRFKECDLLDVSVQVVSQRKHHQHFQASSLVKMGSASATMYPVCVRQLELPVTRTSGASSLITHPEASKLCCSITEISIHLFPWLIQRTSERNTTASRPY
ncbi:uncharacterized protein LOC143224076 [Tachypleus tridentatus]|uniref:uncharacterized protein LOC143224076 n=1 Tax=Tachypleus tridentatus TaxID=6853 RepID=UPI003FD2A903